MLRIAAILVLLVLAGGAVAFTALQGGEDEAPAPAYTGPPSGSAEGVLTKVEETKLTLRPAAGGEVEEFGLRPIDRGRIDLFHLLEHVREEWPVRVSWEVEDGVRYATRVDDA